MATFHFDLSEKDADGLLRIGSDDPQTFVTFVSVSRDNEASFALNWGRRVIHFTAIEACHRVGNNWDVDWMVLDVGSQGLNIAPYRFAGIEELRAATELVLSALLAFNGRRAHWSQMIYTTRSVRLSPAMKALVYGDVQ